MGRLGQSLHRLGAGALLLAVGLAPAVPTATAAAGIRPAVSEFTQVTASETPPTEAQCMSVGRRCFTPASLRSAYNLQALYDQGLDGTGTTVAIVDAYGSDTIAHDLHVYNQAFGLPAMCGEEGVACAAGMPTFSQLALQGNPATKAPPSTSRGTGQEDRSGWALEVSLDVEAVHSVAPGANILLVTTPTAETLGVQGFPQMMAAEQYVVDHHLANVISQSFASAEDAFGSSQSLMNLRHAFVSAAQNGVTVLGSSGDSGAYNDRKTPVGQGGSTITTPTVQWPASDPLVTGVGGTYLCTDPVAAADQPRTVDSADPPVNCQNNPGQAEVAWVASGGGFSHVFSKPDYQATLPAGSTPIGSMRGVPDIASQASARTGLLIYVSLPPYTGLKCGSTTCSSGWYDVGGTSESCPEWAGLVSIADQLNGGGLGLINPALYKLANDPAAYGNDFYDVTVGSNTTDPSLPGYAASPGWDPVTGLGTPNAANLVPALVAAAHS